MFVRTISQNNLIEKGDLVAIGVSGGMDSMSLLHLLSKFSKKTNVNIVAVSIDEGTPGYRDKCIENVKKFCVSLGVEHHTQSYKEAFGFNIEDLDVKKFCTYCGVFRRKLLNQKAKKIGATKLAIGHNLDDEAQSVLMNVLRGDVARIQRLGPKPGVLEDEGFVPRIKPLRNVLKKELAVYSIVNELPIFEGSCPRSGDNTRRDVQALLMGMERKYPGTRSQIVKFYDKIKPKIVEKNGEFSYCETCGDPCSSKICKACELLEKLRSG